MSTSNDKEKTENTDRTLEWTSPITPEYLVRFNKAMFVLHLIQGVLMIIAGQVLEFSRDLYTFYYDYSGFPIIAPNPEVAFAFDALGALVGSFLLMSATAHFLLAWPLRKRYIENLKRNYNPIRWWEYAFSSSVMIVLIAIFFSVVDIWTLFAMFVLNFLMNMFGWMQEKINRKGNKEKVDWSAYILGCVAGIAPWIIVVAYFLGTNGTPPDFVYVIFIVELVLFNSFAFIMVAYYKKWGKFKDYAFGERAYQILSLVAKSLLAWLVFGGVFQPS